jgi:hypothetical protein
VSDDFAQLVAGSHVVVRAIEDLLDEGGALGGVRSFAVLEGGEEAVGGMIDEEDELLACDALGGGRPVPPTEFFRNDELIPVAEEFEFLILFVEDFGEEEPTELLQALGIARDAAVLPHDFADVFDDGGDAGH